MLTARETPDLRETVPLSPRLSLIQMLAGIAVLAVLPPLAAPPFTDFVSKSRLASSVATLAADLSYARREAILRSTPVIVCAKETDSSNCATTLNWRAGWIICIDANADNVCDKATASSPNPIRVRHAVSSATVITAGATAVRFNPVGAVTGDGKFTIAGGSAALPSRSIQVTSNGAVQTYAVPAAHGRGFSLL